jgi:transposase-like protein
MSAAIDRPEFHDDDAARAYLENLRWPDGVVCPHCGTVGEATKLSGKKHRPGVWKCNACRKQFTVTVGTVFERSKVPLHKWMLATYLLCSSKKGISSHQIMRMLGVQYKTAWFMTHRIREAMKSGDLAPLGSGGPVEVDETFWGQEPGAEKRHSWHHKMKIVSLVERNGQARSFHVKRVNAETLRPLLQEHIAAGAHVMTDDAVYYKPLHPMFAQHDTVCHNIGEYSRPGGIHTNTVEGFFAMMKRGLNGVYHHVGYDHLDSYLAEFDFRYNYRDVNDLMRTAVALQGIEGKRLYYKH